MSLLLWFQSIRTPFLDKLFSFVTQFGQEAICLGIICFLFWCWDKKTAYKLGFSFYFSALIIQCMKISFRVPRPWHLNPDVQPVESAMPHATGYSFPSGHTQIATSLYSTGIFCFKSVALKILSGALIAAVAISRMYLGVHTPADVCVSFLISFAVAFIIFFNFEKIYDIKNVTTLSVILGVVSAAVWLFAFFMQKEGYIPYTLASDCYKAAGAGIGFSIGYFLERKYIDFDEKYGNVCFHILKFIFGASLVFLIRGLSKAFFPKEPFFDMLRYLFVALSAISLYPFIIKIITEQKKKKEHF